MSAWKSGSAVTLSSFSRDAVCSTTQGLWVNSQSSGSMRFPELIRRVIKGPSQVQSQIGESLRNRCIGSATAERRTAHN